MLCARRKAEIQTELEGFLDESLIFRGNLQKTRSFLKKVHHLFHEFQNDAERKPLLSGAAVRTAVK